MSTSELHALVEQLKDMGVPLEEAAQAIKIPAELIALYLNSPPVPISVLNPLKKLIKDKAN
jgi:hypothetical protein